MYDSLSHVSRGFTRWTGMAIGLADFGKPEYFARQIHRDDQRYALRDGEIEAMERLSRVDAGTSRRGTSYAVTATFDWGSHIHRSERASPRCSMGAFDLATRSPTRDTCLHLIHARVGRARDKTDGARDTDRGGVRRAILPRTARAESRTEASVLAFRRCLAGRDRAGNHDG